jgi:hypothetical protein
MISELIKLKEGYIIVSNEEIENYYFNNHTKEIYLETHPKRLEVTNKELNKEIRFKIIASTFIPELPNIDFNGLEEEFGIIDVEKLANEQWGNVHRTGVLGYIEGFGKCLSLNKDKLYTEKDIKNAIKWLTKNDSKVEDELAHPLETNQVELPDNFFENVYEEALNRAIQSLQPKTEWDIEVEKTENSIKIIKNNIYHISVK